ncbi:MAG TPA: DinB family protein [Anaerolineae bacterium]|nr:DinB family protein [Anaerolineae bacterium]
MKRASQEKKDDYLSGLIAARRAILEVAAALPPEKRDEVFLGVWSIKDLTAHLIGWDYVNLQAAEEVLAGKVPSFFAHYDPDWKTFNAQLVEEYTRDDFAQLLSSVEESQRKLIDFLKTIPAEEFDKDRGVRTARGARVTIGRNLQAEIDDEKVHYRQIKDFAAAANA